jgi:hypothetical protein
MLLLLQAAEKNSCGIFSTRSQGWCEIKKAVWRNYQDMVKTNSVPTQPATGNLSDVVRKRNS